MTQHANSNKRGIHIDVTVDDVTVGDGTDKDVSVGDVTVGDGNNSHGHMIGISLPQ